MKALIVAFVITACTPDESQVLGPSPPDAAMAGNGSGSGSGASSISLPIKVSINTVANASGTSITKQYFVTSTSVQPGDDFWIESCDSYAFDVTPPPACPSGDTCTTTGDPVPTGRDCEWAKLGTFFNDTLYVNAGYEIVELNVNGVQISDGGYRYTSVTLHKN